MHDDFIRAAAITPKVALADPAENARRIEALAHEAESKGAMLICTPELSLTGYTCGDLFLQDELLESALSELQGLAARSAGHKAIVITSLPLCHRGKLYCCAAVYGGGELLGLVAKTYIPNYGEFYELRHFTPWTGANDYADVGCLIGTKLLFKIPGMRRTALFAIEICEDLWAPVPPSSAHAAAGASIIFNLSAGDETIGKSDYRRLLTRSQSGRLVAGYVYVNAGYGESTTDMVFSGHCIAAENGSIIAEKLPFANEEILISDIDLGAISHDRRYRNTYDFDMDMRRSANEEYITIGPAHENAPYANDIDAHSSLNHGMTDRLMRIIDPHPFVPSDPATRDERCELILTMQATGLASRIEKSHAKTVVIGISGGLDSTLALLVCVRAARMAGLGVQDILAVTMPCFGTSTRTKHNADHLAQALGVSYMDIDISAQVREHFTAIAHDESSHDVVYENAQARIRTLVLMDLANAHDGIVVGTGDLSELALGWATYNGDHMSMYGVNAGVPKTLVRYIVAYEADRLELADDAKTADILRDVLDTPVSPELLPPEDGDISQRTEDLVGPYELHDFFLYHMLRFGRRMETIRALARCAFSADAYGDEEIDKWLGVFMRRFRENQFKRSALPDGPKIGSVSVSPRGDLRMPSDL